MIRLLMLLQILIYGIVGSEAASAIMNTENGHHRELSYSDFEFGRQAVMDEKLLEAEEALYFRALQLDMSLSMDMSMSMSLEETSRTPTLSPSISLSPSSEDESPSSPPTLPFELSEASIAAICGSSQDQGDVNVLLDVDTLGSLSNVSPLEDALTIALDTDFPFCTDGTRRGRRGLIERKLSEDFYLRLVIVTMATDGESCNAIAELADQCTVVNAYFEVVGDEENIAAIDIPTALALILDYDDDFEKLLASNNIFDVRFHEELTESSLNDNPEISAKQGTDAGRPPIATILSVTAGSVVVILLLRRISKGKKKEVAGDDVKDDADSQEGETVLNTIGEQSA